MGLRRRKEQPANAGVLDEVRRQAGPWPGAQRAAKVAVLAVLVGAVTAGPLALGITLGQRQQPAAATPVVVDRTAERAQAHAAAVAFVRTWWAATDTSDDQVTGQLSHPVAGARFPHEPRPAPTGVDVVTARPVGQRWLVTVVVWAADGAGVYLQVPIRVQGSATSVLALPARVGAPTRFRAEVDRGDAVSHSDARVVATVGFLTSWLTGRSDVERWAVPGTVPPMVGQVCAQVQLLQATAPAAPASPAAGQTVMDVDVSCTTAAGPTDPYSYRLTLQRVSGQWAVASIDG